MHMKKATNITLATLAAALLASSCIKEADPYEIATEDQVTLETLIEGIPASLVQAGSAGYAKRWPSLGFCPAGHPYRHGIHDGRRRHRRQYRLRLVRTVGNQRSARRRLCRGCTHVGQLLCVDHGGQQRHQTDRRLGFRDARRHAEVLSGLRLRLSGHVLPRSGASVRVQGEQLHRSARGSRAGRAHRTARDYRGRGQEQPPCQGRRHLRSSDLPRPGQGRRTVERLYGSRQVYDQSGAGLRTESPGLA